MYTVGLIGPLLFWVFVFFVISRLNEKTDRNSNPHFFDSSERESMQDNDKEAIVNHSGNLKPVRYDDLRWDYHQMSTESPQSAIGSKSQDFWLQSVLTRLPASKKDKGTSLRHLP